MTDCYVFDIDGTLADVTHRLHHIQKSPKDWPAFFAAAVDDQVIKHVAKIAYGLYLANEEIIFVSGRPEEWKDDTADWIFRHRIVPQVILIKPRLYMRKTGDFRDDDIVKAELLAKVREGGWNPVMVFDDRSRCVTMWRAAGIPCAQVAEGNF